MSRSFNAEDGLNLSLSRDKDRKLLFSDEMSRSRDRENRLGDRDRSRRGGVLDLPRESDRLPRGERLLSRSFDISGEGLLSLNRSFSLTLSLLSFSKDLSLERKSRDLSLVLSNDLSRESLS